MSLIKMSPFKPLALPSQEPVLLQILEDGRLTSGRGRTVSFKNILIIMSSNVGSSVIVKGGQGTRFELEYGEKDGIYNRIKSFIGEELKEYLRPEYFNRLDEIIVFRQLANKFNNYFDI